jgi:exodeoxyribonuclease III
MRLVSLNLNGIRSAANKGLPAWVEALQADCMGVQELKAQAQDLSLDLSRLDGMQGHFHFAQKKGYSGVGMYTRHTPTAVITGLGIPEFDDEGRYVEVRHDTPERKLSVISCYFPSRPSSVSSTRSTRT